MTRALRPIPISLLLFLAGCGLTLGEDDGLRNACSADADCAGAVCEEPTGLCVTEAAEPFRIGISVTPSSDTGSVAQMATFPTRELSGPAEHDFAMPPTVLVSGRVRWSATGESVPARVRFVRPSAFPGGPAIEIEGSTSPEYQVRVPVGEVYDVIVEPTGDAAHVFPPLYLRDMVPPMEGDVWNLDINYPSQFSKVFGAVFSLDGTSEVPENGLQVRAIEVGTERVVSSTAITGTSASLPLAEDDPGQFTIRLSPGAGAFVLRIGGGPDRSLFPTLTIDPNTVFPGSIVVPQLEPVRYEGTVEATMSSGVEAVADAVVTFRSDDVFGDIEGVTGSFRATGATDADGRFSVTVLPGTYDVIVAPPTGASAADGTTGTFQNRDLGVSVQQVRIEPSSSTIRGQIFTVGPRAQLGGRVRSFAGDPIAMATVHAAALGRLLPSADAPEAAFNRSNDAMTDVNGLFDLRLDVGAYDLSIRPQSGSGFPWVVRPGWSIAAQGTVVNEDFTIPAPVPVRGLVTTHDGAPLAGAEVRAHAIFTEGASVRTVPIGRAVTDLDGNYELLLPPGL